MAFDIKTAAFIFPGQGSQVVGMGKALAEAYPSAGELFAEADSILGFPFSNLIWEGSGAEINETVNTQPALFIHSLAAYTVANNLLKDQKPIFMAGHSLGELSAIAAAGALSFQDGLRLVRMRGELMKRAGEINPGGMAAILGLDIPSLEKVCAEASSGSEIVQVANDNCPGQVVISGHKGALERAILGARAAGAKRALPLAVSIAAHSPLMDSIQAEWETAVASAKFYDAKIPVIGNVNGKPMTAAGELRSDVIAQMQSRVRWTESVQYMVSKGASSFVELGPGMVLEGLVKRIVDGISTYHLGNPSDAEFLQVD